MNSATHLILNTATRILNAMNIHAVVADAGSRISADETAAVDVVPVAAEIITAVVVVADAQTEETVTPVETEMVMAREIITAAAAVAGERTEGTGSSRNDINSGLINCMGRTLS